MNKQKLIFDLSLGDAYLTIPKSKNGNSLIKMNHSIKQRDYALYKKDLLEKNGIRTIYREKTYGGYDICYVMTGRLPEITEIRNLLYVNRKKEIPRRLFDFIDERSLAYLTEC